MSDRFQRCSQSSSAADRGFRICTFAHKRTSKMKSADESVIAVAVAHAKHAAALLLWG